METFNKLKAIKSTADVQLPQQSDGDYLTFDFCEVVQTTTRKPKHFQRLAYYLNVPF